VPGVAKNYARFGTGEADLQDIRCERNSKRAGAIFSLALSAEKKPPEVKAGRLFKTFMLKTQPFKQASVTSE